MDGQKEKISPETLKQLNLIIRDFSTAIRNSVLYTSDHPICVFSINNLLASLSPWFQSKSRLDLGIAQDKIFADGIVIDEKNERFQEIANFLHLRGIVAISILKGVEKPELVQFLSVIRDDAKIIHERGGVLKNLPSLTYLKVQEIDYSALLTSASGKAVTEEEEVWQSLFAIAKEAKIGTLPGSKVEFLVNFFQDTRKAAKTLNRVYRDAVERLQDDKVVSETKEAIVKICEYFDKNEAEGVKESEVKVKLMDVITQLHPDLIASLFEQTTVEGENFDLAETITKDFSDSFIAGFIESLISDEDKFNENLLKVFDKLSPSATKSSSIVSMVADKMLTKRILNKDTLAKLQMSVKEILKDHPESNFMSEMYKITVDAVTNKKIDTLIYVAKLNPAINRFVQSLKEEKLKKEEVWLLLNILWLESNSSEFEKFGEKLVEILPELLDSKDVERIREITEFFTEKSGVEQKRNKQMTGTIEKVFEHIAKKENLESLVALMPEAKSKEVEDIAAIFGKAKNNPLSHTAQVLIDAYLAEKLPACRNKYKVIFARTKDETTKEIIERLEYGEPYVVRDLLHLLREHAPEKAHLVAKRLIAHRNALIRWEGLEGFEPATEEDRENVFFILKREKDKEVQKKAATALLKTNDSAFIEKMFKLGERSFFRKNFLIRLVELCGYYRKQETFPYLERIFRKKAFLNMPWRNELRIAAATSLARLHSKEALDLVKEGTKDGSEKVRKMCEILLKLDEQKATEGKTI
ncbi:MAG: hypothetical protein PHW46_00795 [Candidatus Omnitrophica bacterium]|nr:hypothetical protein [Candidatus Omnitrophota bacterium]